MKGRSGSGTTPRSKDLGPAVNLLHLIGCLVRGCVFDRPVPILLGALSRLANRRSALPWRRLLFRQPLLALHCGGHLKVRYSCHSDSRGDRQQWVETVSFNLQIVDIRWSIHGRPTVRRRKDRCAPETCH